jgi:saccharopine dehydrogenase (NAD+, L-lysine-forming)
MKALVLGGFGIMGSSAARDLIKSDMVKRVILADKKVDMAKVHESVRTSKKISTQTLDVTDFEALVNAIKGNDVVINTVGPFYKFGAHTIKAAIKAGINYIDICDDYDATREALTLDESARKAGVSICIGFGAGPGISNLLAKYAADKLDEVDEIKFLWAAGLNDPVGFSALLHGMHMFTGNVPQYLNGKLVDVPAGSGGEEVKFVEPTGKAEVYYVGHPEPVTLPRYIKGVKTVVNKGGVLPTWASKMIMEWADRGFLDPEPLKVGDVAIPPQDFMVALLKSAPKFRKQVEHYTDAPSIVLVKGKKGGQNITYSYSSGGRQAPGTGIACSIAAQMLCRGDVKVKGVVAPEGALDPKAYFAEFAKRGMRIFEEKTAVQ